MRITRAGVCGGVLMAAATQLNAGTVDAKLLDMLLSNGSITKAQHAELSADLAREQKAEERAQKKASKEKLDKKEFVAFQQLAGWTTATKFTGDMRVRQDYINIEDERKNGRDQDRQRMRARLGATTQVNEEVEVGIQIASGSSADRRSTNQTMTDYFDKKPVWVDLGYINYKPLAVPGLKLFAGKMKQPWVSMGDVAFDGDINPEGFAAQHQIKNGTTTFFGSLGYYDLRDNVNGEGVEWKNDLAMYQLQGGVAFDPSDDIRLTVGAGVFDFNKDKYASTTSFRANGNTTDQFGLGEVFAQMDVIGLPLPLPLTVYGQYVQNYQSRDVSPTDQGDEDTAWLFGLRTNIAGIAFDYNYRDVERNAVVGGFTDSDFASGYTGSSGHKLKAQYDFLRNFNLVVTWMPAESDAASRNNPDEASVETLMVDLNAKF